MGGAGSLISGRSASAHPLRTFLLSIFWLVEVLVQLGGHLGGSSRRGGGCRREGFSLGSRV